MMNKKTLWIVRTALMLAVLVALQAATKSFGQLVTGSCVNGVLFLSVTLCGLSTGAVVALLSPVLAYLLGIAPQILTVPAIMLGNLTFVLVLNVADWTKYGIRAQRVIAVFVAAVLKSAVLYLIVVQLMCNVFSEQLIGAGVMKEAMLTALPTTFGVTQLFTAMIGGSIGLVLFVPLRRAVKLDRG